MVTVTYITASLTANCFNKLYLLHRTAGKSLERIVSAEGIKGRASTPVKQFKSRRHLTVLDERRDSEPDQGPCKAADSAGEPA